MRNARTTTLLAALLILSPLPGLAQTTEPTGNGADAPATGARATQATSPDAGTSPQPGTNPGDQAPAEATAQPQAVTGTTDAVANLVGTLSPLIEDVQILGPWIEGERNGVWRAVMARSPAQPTVSQFYLQQIAPSADGAQIVRSINVDEVGALGGAVVGYSADEPTEGQEGSLTVFFEIVPSDGEISETYQLNAQPDGSYEFGIATN
ncbi:hypothetical protein DYI37_02220 [Fulvimarina endophytica]|uniref:DNA topoisomerase IV subunit B n=1 Tax=Fulvimarina endophytica TaxID=2293836 RepID=A0A371XAL8_9HYPH|nr:hypothetical protein [Fulvimarina endophytica]RFC66287.1 hypothetical protein DYI37_02220 [Fulvimarina endophytica]